MQRTLFAIVLVGMIVVVLFVTFFFTSFVPVGSMFAAMITPPTPIPTRGELRKLTPGAE